MCKEEKVNRKVYAVKGDREAPYPRICAHRGFNTVAPENSMAAFGSAIALGAAEIELDVRFTLDGIPVVSHDSSLERCSNGSGTIEGTLYRDLLKLDFGGRFSPRFAGLSILPFEAVLERFAGSIIINLHLKNNEDEVDIYPEEKMRKIVALLEKYDQCCHTYFVGRAPVLKQALKVCPGIPRCMAAFPDPWKIVEYALEFQCEKAQFFTPYFNQEMIGKARENNIKCNFFYCDDPEKAVELFKMGIDTILTNDYWPVAFACREIIGKEG